MGIRHVAIAKDILPKAKHVTTKQSEFLRLVQESIVVSYVLIAGTEEGQSRPSHEPVIPSYDN